MGLMFAIDLVRDKHSGEPLDAAAMLPVLQGMFAKGLWVHPAESKVLLLPPFIMDETVLEEAYTGLRDVLARAHAWI